MSGQRPEPWSSIGSESAGTPLPGTHPPLHRERAPVVTPDPHPVSRTAVTDSPVVHVQQEQPADLFWRGAAVVGFAIKLLRRFDTEIEDSLPDDLIGAEERKTKTQKAKTAAAA